MKRIPDELYAKLPTETNGVMTRFGTRSSNFKYYGFSCRWKFRCYTFESKWVKALFALSNRPMSRADLHKAVSFADVMLTAMSDNRAQLVTYSRKSNTYSLTQLGREFVEYIKRS